MGEGGGVTLSMNIRPRAILSKLAERHSTGKCFISILIPAAAPCFFHLVEIFDEGKTRYAIGQKYQWASKTMGAKGEVEGDGQRSPKKHHSRW